MNTRPKTLGEELVAAIVAAQAAGSANVYERAAEIFATTILPELQDRRESAKRMHRRAQAAEGRAIIHRKRAEFYRSAFDEMVEASSALWRVFNANPRHHKRRSI